MRAVWLVGFVCAGCPADPPFPVPDPDAGLDAEVPPDGGIEIHGRVVDFETCPIPPGCEAVAGMTVEVIGTAAVSAPTGREGAFLVRGAPRGERLVLAVEGAGYVRTISALAVPASEQDVFDVVVYALPLGEGTLLEAIESERGADVAETGGYVGQVVDRIEGGSEECPDLEEGFCAVEGASATVEPDSYGAVVYVNALPSFVPGEDVLLDGASSTTSSGLFLVLAAEPGSTSIGVAASHATVSLDAVDGIQVEPGAVTLGIHRAN
jgi:hypothetical protein